MLRLAFHHVPAYRVYPDADGADPFEAAPDFRVVAVQLQDDPTHVLAHVGPADVGYDVEAVAQPVYDGLLYQVIQKRELDALFSPPGITPPRRCARAERLRKTSS